MSLAISLKPGEHLVYIAFGGNLGDVELAINTALVSLQKELGSLVKKSKIYRTSPLTATGVDPNTVPTFYNGAALFRTKLNPFEVLSACLETEKSLGRLRDPNNPLASRTIDLDIALFDNLVLAEDNLTIPHPRLHERDFVLIPLIEIESKLVHPKLCVPLSDLLANLKNCYMI